MDKAAAEDKDEDQKEDSSAQATSRQWKEIKPKPFRTQKVSFVVCLNTMGQDREFTPEEVKFALRTVRDYAD
jgi:hypothetical protein